MVSSPDWITISLSQLATQAPTLLVHAAGALLALAFWRRGPTACAFVLGGSILLLLLTTVQPFLFHFLIRRHHESGGSNSSLGLTINVVTLGGSLLRALAYAMALAAVFVPLRGRRTGAPPPDRPC